MKTLDNDEFRRAIGEFNSGHYFECHDTLEALWVLSSGGERRFLQGMIQVSVGFYHFFNGNPSGALSQWGKGRGKLEAFAPAYGGIDLEMLLGSVGDWILVASRTLSGEKVPVENLQTPTCEFHHNR
ncbi:MAG TPA: DUF309 domain-containing protein [Bacteroidota bacterium]|nr:DUF309 domain-containing protein [Bacteroidota bacterium]